VVDSQHRQLHFVTGKGGVGKSLVACALASRFVAEGHRTLLCQVNARDSHTALMGTGPVGDDVAAAGRNLWTVNFTPAQATREYALMTLKLESLYKAVFDNRVTRTFLRFVPSLNELTMMGKLWFHAEERREKAGIFGGTDLPRFDRIVVDCPSTGHALKLFSISRVLTDAVRVGPLVDKTRQMASVFGDPQRSAVHLVTLPEELPVNETLELLATLRAEGSVSVGHVIVNQVVPRVFDDVRASTALDRMLAAPLTVSLASVAAAGRRRRDREVLEGRELARAKATDRPVAQIPLLGESPLTPAHVARVGAMLKDIR
jgi:anion-transporting  ArsA/GET3 family ATPase